MGTVSFRLSRARDLLRARLNSPGSGAARGLGGRDTRIGNRAGGHSLRVGRGHEQGSDESLSRQGRGGRDGPGLNRPARTRRNPHHDFHKNDDDRGGCGGDRSRRDGYRPGRGGREADRARTRAPTTAKAEAAPSPAPAQEQKSPPQASGDDREARAQSRQNLMNLGLAMNNFARNGGRNQLPAAAIRKNGQQLLSWRVALLPSLGEQALYEKFHLDEPWDSAHNKALLDQMPAVYAPVTRKDDESKHLTYYQVFAGPGSLFGADEGARLGEIKDAANLTIALVEAATPVPWTKPEDIPFDKDKPLPELGGQFKDGFHALMAGGGVRFLRRQIKPEVLCALITSNGGEAISFNDLKR